MVMNQCWLLVLTYCEHVGNWQGPLVGQIAVSGLSLWMICQTQSDSTDTLLQNRFVCALGRGCCIPKPSLLRRQPVVRESGNNPAGEYHTLFVKIDIFGLFNSDFMAHAPLNSAVILICPEFLCWKLNLQSQYWKKKCLGLTRLWALPHEWIDTDVVGAQLLWLQCPDENVSSTPFSWMCPLAFLLSTMQ